MDWKELGKTVAAYGLPALGAVLPVPGGAAIGAALARAINSPSEAPADIAAALAGSAEAVAKAREFEAKHEETILQISSQHEISVLQAVNTTMQAESKSEHWPQWSWRPFNGFLFGITMFGCYFVLPLLKMPVPSVPFEAWAGWGAVLGVASWWRGKGKL